MIKVDSIEPYKSEKILNISEAFNLIGNLKSNGKKVGLCHGGFDLLHPGQIKHFESAKKMCDILFVSITSDRFVGSRKGSGRPIFSDKLRAYMAAKMKDVDYVTISDYKTGIEVINYLQPSFYIKGPDFINKRTPGITAERQAIKDIGGEMRYTNDPKLSTTEIINYIKNEVDNKKILLCIDRDGTIIEEQDFLGKEADWKDKVKLREGVVSLISFLQTRYNTKKIIVSNQAGVARGYFDCKRVEEINNYVNYLLAQREIIINDWQYCPCVDSKFAESKKNEIQFNFNFVRETTSRKPSDKMVLDSLEKLNENINDFAKIIVLGDRDEDKELAEKLNALYIDVKGKDYESLLSEFKVQNL